MCNGWNHKDDCACGFGPPYDLMVEIIPRNRVEWVEESLWDENKIRRGLKELGVKKEDFNALLKDYHTAGYPVEQVEWEESAPEKRSQILSKIKRILGLREKVIEKKGYIPINVPLFKVQAPDVPLSRVTYEEEITDKQRGSWSVAVAIPGIGTGATQNYTVKVTSQFYCDSGAGKAILARLLVRAALINIYRKGKLIGSGIRLEAKKNKNSQTFNRKIMPCPKEDFKKANIKEPLASFDLLGEAVQDRATLAFAWGNEKNREAKIGLPIPGLDIHLEAGVRFEQQLTLKCELPGGYIYNLYPTAHGHGITWVVE